MHGNPFAAPDKAKPLSGRGLDIDLRDVDAKIGRDVLAHGRDMRGHFGCLGDDRGIHVCHAQTLPADQRHHPPQQNATVDTLELGARVGKMLMRAITKILC